jgi:fucose permease
LPHTESSTISKELRLARFATCAMFFINGGAVATWASRIPTIQEHLTLSSGQLGVVLLSMAIGALLAMSIAGALASSIGSRPIIVWAMVFSCFALVFPAFAPNMWFLALSVVALGYASFSATMCIGRLTGDAVNKAMGARNIVTFGSLIAIAGLTLVVAPLNPYMAVAGFALVGIGVANIVPIAFSCAGNAPNTQPGLAIASVSLMGYFGLLAGPPIVGFAAEALTLRVALCLLAVLAVTMICMAGRVSDSASEKLAKS